MRLTHPALAYFRALPLRERLFVRARLFSAPLVEVAAQATGEQLLDVGCGHGLLCALLAHADPRRQLVGIDPDPRKIEWARRSVGTAPGTRFEGATVEALAAREPGRFDCVTVADVLYLLPPAAHGSFLTACAALLKPGGRLLLKEAEDDGGWRAKKALLQEAVMVRALGRTRSSGAIGFSERAVMQAAIEHAGFHLDEVKSLSAYSTTPHVLYLATRVSASPAAKAP